MTIMKFGGGGATYPAVLYAENTLHKPATQCRLLVGARLVSGSTATVLACIYMYMYSIRIIGKYVKEKRRSLNYRKHLVICRFVYFYFVL